MCGLGIMPAAGLGTRLYPFKGAKELLPLGQQVIDGIIRPKLVSQYGLEAMSLAGINNVIMPITSKKKAAFNECLSNGKKVGVDISYLIINNSLSMVETIARALKGHRNERIFFGMPDTCVLPTDCFVQLLEEHEKHGSCLSLGLFQTSEPHKYGMIKTDSHNRVFYHKDKPNNTSAEYMWGIAIWEPVFSDFILKNIAKFTEEKTGELTFGDVMDRFMNNNTIYGFTIKRGRYYDVGTYDGYKKAVTEL